MCSQDPLVAAARAKANDSLAMHLHLKFAHQNMDYIRRTAKLGQIEGLPQNISDLKYDCPLCKIAAAAKLPRGPLQSTRFNSNKKR